MLSVRRFEMIAALVAAFALTTPRSMLLADDAEGAAPDAAKVSVITVEDAEDAAAQAADRWQVIRRHSGSNESVAYVYDEQRKSRVVEFKSTGLQRTPWIRDVWFTELTEQGYAFKRDDLMQGKLLKEGLIHKDDQGNFRFVPEVLGLVDRYALRDHLKQLQTPFTDDEITVTLSLWARCRELGRSKLSVPVDRPIAEDEEVEVAWAMRFDPTSWNARSFTVYVQVDTGGRIEHMFYYLKSTHVADLENQGEEKKYKWAPRDVIFYWRLLDKWATEPGPASRGRYIRSFLDDQLARQTPADGWYTFRCNLSQDLRNAKNFYSLDRSGVPKRNYANLRIKEIKSFDVAAGDCRIDDVRFIVTKK